MTRHVLGKGWIPFVGLLFVTGCVAGYNSLIFATKTNVGLVVDTKPPEVNIDIGRYEGLLAPTYEAGKTPPVMASFRFDSNKGFLSNYIGSTFTTGDASVAMARLYDAPDGPEIGKAKAWDNDATQWRSLENKFDSTVDLALEPKMPFFVPKEEPGAVRPVLFATDTSMGFKVSWSGTNSAMPDYLRLAYQRRELAFAAVTVGPKLRIDPENKKPPEVLPGLEVRVPSLLATVDAQVKANEFVNSSFNYLQYFASGSAATSLAMREKVRSAMLARLDPEAARQPSGEASAFSGATEGVAIETLSAMMTFFEARAADKGAPAEERALASSHLGRLNALERLVPANYPFNGYQLENTAIADAYIVDPNVNRSKAVKKNGFKGVLSYWGEIGAASTTITNDMIGKANLVVKDKAGGTPVADPEKAVLGELTAIEKERREFGQLIKSNKDVLDARKDFCERFAGSSQS